ncbi:MAG: TonB-dependent receptor [Gammaproteobacteria bacterium]|nr:TonB-dependent receptor [Gammaproteobacteria bacterium]
MKPSSPKTLLATAVMAVMTAETAFAQLEEVVVTAERREASVQDTPISIEALTEKDIQDRGIYSNLDMINEVVGVNGYGSPQGGSSTAFVIRGIGDGAPNISLDPAAGRYIDGVYIGKNQGSSPDVVDLARIEVLKGPQGTLSGRNSTSGTINYVSKAPSEEFDMSMRAGTGNYGRREYAMRVDIPFSDSFRTAISYNNRDRDVFYQNTNPRLEGFNGVDRDGYRVALAWDMTDRLSVDYSFANSKVNDEQDNHSIVAGFNPSYPAVAGYLAAGGDQTNVPIDSASRIATVQAIAGGVAQSVQFGLLPNLPQIQQFIGWADDYVAWANGILANSEQHPYSGSSDVNSFASVDNEAHTLTLNYEWSDTVNVKYVYGERTMNDRSQSDLDGIDNSVSSGVRSDLTLQTIGGALFGQVVPDLGFNDAAGANFQLAIDMIDAINANNGDGIFWTDLENSYEQESHELQIIGSSESLDWAVGAYHWEDYGESRNVQNATYTLSASNSTGFDVGGDAKSVFGEATWRMDDQWSFTAGLRYTDETKYMTYRWRSFPAGGLASYIGATFAGAANANILGAGYVGTVDNLMNIPETAGIYGNYNEQSFSNVSGRLVAQYAMNDDTNFYASYTTGYRAGGFNGGNFDRGTMSGDEYTEETIGSMEFGMKSTLMDGRMRLNAALFSYDYDDVQVSVIKSDEGGVSTDVVNAASFGTEGLELDLAFLVTDTMTLRAQYAYIDREYDDFPSYQGLAIEPTQGLTPENAYNVVMDWNMLNFGSNSIDLQVSANYQDETVSITSSTTSYTATGQPAIAANMQQPSNQERTLVNARLSWSSELEGGQRLNVTAWGRNITDEQYRTFGFNFGAALGFPVHQWGNPATYGIDFSLDL